MTVLFYYLGLYIDLYCVSDVDNLGRSIVNSCRYYCDFLFYCCPQVVTHMFIDDYEFLKETWL